MGHIFIEGKEKCGVTEALEDFWAAAPQCSQLWVDSAEREPHLPPGRWMEAPRHLEVTIHKG